MCKVEHAELYDKGRPKPGGLNDLRMGTTDRHLLCETDQATATDSPGYFGHIELGKPVYHVGYIKTVLKVLRCVSYYNSRVLLDKVRAGGNRPGAGRLGLRQCEVVECHG